MKTTQYVVVTRHKSCYIGSKIDIVGKMFRINRNGRTFNYRADFDRFDDDNSSLGYDDSWGEEELAAEVVKDLFQILKRYGCTYYKQVI